MNNETKQDRNDEIVALFDSGIGLVEIARRMDLHKSRVLQLVKRAKGFALYGHQRCESCDLRVGHDGEHKRWKGLQ